MEPPVIGQAIANAVLDECESTNDLARALGERGLPHGTWVSARVQTRGRGRLGREWKGEPGNLFLSIVLRIESRALWSWVPLASAVGAAKTLRLGNPRFKIEIKWPNDLWLDRKKLGGILCEAVGNRDGAFIVMGMGLNCRTTPDVADQPVTSLSESLGSPLKADDVREELIAGILAELRLLETFGHGPLRQSYLELAALRAGTEIEWTTLQHERFSGTIEGMGESGELLVRLPDGKAQSLFAEDVKVRARF